MGGCHRNTFSDEDIWKVKLCSKQLICYVALGNIEKNCRIIYTNNWWDRHSEKISEKSFVSKKMEPWKEIIFWSRSGEDSVVPY